MKPFFCSEVGKSSHEFVSIVRMKSQTTDNTDTVLFNCVRRMLRKLQYTLALFLIDLIAQHALLCTPRAA